MPKCICRSDKGTYIHKKEKMIADLTAELEEDKAKMVKLAERYMEETGTEIK